MGTINRALSAARNPASVFHHLHWRYHRHFRGETGVKLMTRDWDNLLILDACRYDLFAECNTLPGELSKVTSAGSHTVEFLHSNFDGHEFPDTVYVTATPQFEKEGMADRFAHVEHVWRDAWDKELRTIPPEAVAERTLEVAELFPNKRLISHFVQPHYPFIGETGRGLEQNIKAKTGIEPDERDDNSIWDHLEARNIDEGTIRKAYRENLNLVLPVIKGLKNDLRGKTVVTSDHGNCFGRWGIYGHPSHKFVEELVDVPWLELPFSERRQIVDGEVSESEDVGSSVEERLRDLGYK
ncbi:hypothetical protein [Haloarchaeobius sp. HME9146]|uniref:hypothetical protein n=1 Tax=Haloarchaeobius sp. HME9146 TaxID=2978732 RepID=UPI0021C0CBA6|nr:hypothetical protein [Haloarchaeobius sp. HME9146]MCT9098188.1 hypothetical protein [Haloarchaeobius sp. HME9146]